MADAVPFGGQGVVAPGAGDLGEEAQVHAFLLARVAGQPGLLGGEADDRRQPGGEAVEYPVEYAARRAPAGRGSGVAIETVLAHVEIEGRQIDGTKRVQFREQGMEFQVVASLPHRLVQFPQPVQDPAFQFRHLGVGQALGFREIVQVAQQEAQRVAQAPINVGVVLDDVGAEAQVLGIVRTHHPQAQDVGPVFLDHILGRDDVTQGLGHLLAVLAHDKAVGQHGFVRGPSPGGTGFQERGMEPAAMLVRPFQVEGRRPFQIGALFEDEGVGGPRFEPHVKDIHHLFVVLGVPADAQEARRVRGVPSVRALGLDRLGDALQHRLVAQGLS